MADFERPASCPKPGQNEAFDAGWNAHRAGLSKRTVEALTPGMAVVAWEAREYMAGEQNREPSDPSPEITKPEQQLTIHDELERKDDHGSGAQLPDVVDEPE